MKYRIGGSLSSLTKCIRSAAATWCEFCLEIRRKPKTIAFCCDFLQPNLNENQNNNKKQGLHSSLCSFYLLNWNEDQSKKGLLTTLLFVVVLRDIYFIVRYTFVLFFFCAVFDRQIRMKTKQIRKKRHFLPTLYEGTLNFPLGKAKISMGGR